MTRKSASDAGVFTSVGKALDESMELAAALGTGKLTRAEFDAWYAKRTAEGASLVENLRRRTSRLMAPVQTAVSQGRNMVRSAAPAMPAGRRRSTRRRAASKRPRQSLA
jgi:hypothetical protein